jgi:hypothetical protein
MDFALIGVEQGEFSVANGCVTTQYDMTPEKIKKLEEFYGTKIYLGLKDSRKDSVRSPIETRLYDSWHKIQQRKRR